MFLNNLGKHIKMKIAVPVILIMGFATLLFYLTPIRDHLDSRLDRIKISYSPYFNVPKQVLIVEIDEESIKQFDQEKNDLSYGDLQGIVDLILKHNPKGLMVFLPTQVFKYEDPGRVNLYHKLKNHQNLSLCMFDVETVLDLEWKGLGIDDQIFAGRLYPYKKRTASWRATITEIPSIASPTYGMPSCTIELASKLAKLTKDELIAKIAKSYPGDKPTYSYKIHFFNPSRFNRIALKDFEALKPELDLKDKYILLGYTAFRPHKGQLLEATRMNTPYQMVGGRLELGMPVLDIHALGATTVAHEAWLIDGPLWLNACQIILFTLFAVFVWRFGVTIPLLLYSLGVLCLFVIHIGVIFYFNLNIPAADAIFIATCATFYCAFKKVADQSRHRIEVLEEEKMERELDQIQEKFLFDFAAEFKRINSIIGSKLESIQLNNKSNSSLKTLLSNTKTSNFEFNRYLADLERFIALSRETEKNLDPNRVDIREIIDAAYKQCDNRIKEKNQQVEIECPFGYMVYTDGGMLQQILFNFIINACKYSPMDSTIRIAASVKSRFITISVADQGHGIDKEYFNKIFKKFYRIKNDYVYETKGTGLGLYLCKYFSDLLGGKIELESKIGKGSTFSITLPVRKKG